MPEVAPDPTDDPLRAVGCWTLLAIVLVMLAFLSALGIAVHRSGFEGF